MSKATVRSKTVEPPESGYVDIQVNGFAGVNFSSPSLHLEDIARACNALEARGTAAFCPTLVSSPDEVYDRNIPLLASAMDEDLPGARILGIHVEGPFLSVKACGAHPEHLLRRPDPDLLARWQDLADGALCLLTLAPELPGAGNLIERAVASGLTVGLGHHMGNEQAIRAAAQSGATLSVHLGNGIAHRLQRHPNPLWAQLACDDLSASVIVDGHHVPRSFVRVALRSKGLDNFVLTSDASPPAGLEPGTYEFSGHDVTLSDNGRLSMADKPGLAGSAATMRECARRLAEWENMSRGEITQVGRQNPLRVLGMNEARV